MINNGIPRVNKYKTQRNALGGTTSTLLNRKKKEVITKALIKIGEMWKGKPQMSGRKKKQLIAVSIAYRAGTCHTILPHCLINHS